MLSEIELEQLVAELCADHSDPDEQDGQKCLRLIRKMNKRGLFGPVIVANKSSRGFQFRELAALIDVSDKELNKVFLIFRDAYHNLPGAEDALQNLERGIVKTNYAYQLLRSAKAGKKPSAPRKPVAGNKQIPLEVLAAPRPASALDALSEPAHLLMLLSGAEMVTSHLYEQGEKFASLQDAFLHFQTRVQQSSNYSDYVRDKLLPGIQELYREFQREREKEFVRQRRNDTR